MELLAFAVVTFDDAGVPVEALEGGALIERVLAHAEIAESAPA